MPGIIDELIPLKATGMFGNELIENNDADSICRTAYRYDFPGKISGDAIAITVYANQACAGYPQHLFHITIEGNGNSA
jgi:hypothetical protein